MGYSPRYIRKTVWMATLRRVSLSNELCEALVKEAAFYAVNASTTNAERGAIFRKMLTKIIATTFDILNGERNPGDDLVYNILKKYGYSG